MMSSPTESVQYSETTVTETFNALKRGGAAQDDLARAATAGGGVEALARATKRRVACLELEVENGQICVDPPIFPSICIPLPIDILPDGSVVQACIDICFGGFLNLVPRGFCVTVKFLGDDVVHECVGRCS